MNFPYSSRFSGVFSNRLENRCESASLQKKPQEGNLEGRKVEVSDNEEDIKIGFFVLTCIFSMVAIFLQNKEQS